MNTEIVDEGIFTAEIPEPGILLVRIKRHLVEHLQLLSEKERYFKYLDRTAGNKDIKCIVILGNPQKRGDDEIEEFREKVEEHKHEAHLLERIVNAFQQHVRRMVESPKIVLYGDSGNLTAGYLSLGLAADYFALASNTVLRNINSRLNVLPAGGGAWFLGRRIGKANGLRFLAAENDMSVEEAKEINLCDSVCPLEELESHLLDQARIFASHRSSYLASLKRAMRPDLSELDEWFRHELMSIVRNAKWES